MLYPRESPTRQVKDLSGLWRFKVDRDTVGRKQRWWERPLSDTIPMPVPASYNDLVQDSSIRDHIGDVWYETTTVIPTAWKSEEVVLRIGSASYAATVFANGTEVGRHEGGFLPFEFEIGAHCRFGERNRITVIVNNVLDWTTIPPGQVESQDNQRYPPGYRVQKYWFDFFNYSGIHRPVRLYTRPRTHIVDINVRTDVDGSSGIVAYEITSSGNGEISVRLVGIQGEIVARNTGSDGELRVPNARLWEPLNAYLYTLEVRFLSGGEILDQYDLPIGIRTVRVEGKEFLINGKPFYFRGFGKHEDSDLRGKGLDHCVNVKDFNLLTWIGANSFRTSHYPYSEEIMQLADEYGIVVIDETPAVGLNTWNDSDAIFTTKATGKTQENHLQVIRDLIARDKNHPCVVMWSVANEPASHHEGADSYFRPIFDLTRELDPTRPICVVTNTDMNRCKITDMADIVCVNRYDSWYGDSGRLEVIATQMGSDILDWWNRYHKPVFLTEFGADTIAGFHQDPPVMFTEEYQCRMLEEFFRVLDRQDFVIGEHVWAFADFATAQDVKRVVGNRKGVFTRQRQPKMAAHLLRRRWYES